MDVEIDVLTGDQAANFNNRANIFVLVGHSLSHLLISNKTTKSVVLFGLEMVRLSLEGIPNLAMLSHFVPSQDKNGFTVWKSLANNQQRLYISVAFNFVNVIKIVAK